LKKNINLKTTEEMENFTTNAWILLGIFIVMLILKLILPIISYLGKISLWIALLGAIYFARIFVNLLNTDTDLNLWPLISCILCCIYIIKGGKTVAYKTTTGVFSKITRKPVGYMNAGSLNWACPIFEIVTISVNGVPGTSADLQELKVLIAETPLMQTATRGIQAKVKKISFMLKLDGNIAELFNVEGGAKTIRKRIVEFADEFFLDKISHITPEDLDQNKAKIIKKLAADLQREMNEFCKKNHYPYNVSSQVIIGDTELEPEYYKVLAKKEFASLEQDALDIDATRLKARLLDLGTSLLPTGTENERLKAAMVALKITPKTIEEKSYGVSPEISELMKELAGIFFKKNTK
jgi:hypothetical protein